MRPLPLPPNQVLVALCSGIRISAPTIGPYSVPAPPSAAMMIICTETRIPSPLSGFTKPTLKAYSEPATLVSAALSISASSLVRRTGTPRLLAARSPARIARR